MKSPLSQQLAKFAKSIFMTILASGSHLNRILWAPVFLGKNLAAVPEGSIVLFPYRGNMLCCGIAALVSYKNSKTTTSEPTAVNQIEEIPFLIEQQGFAKFQEKDIRAIDEKYLGGKDLVDSLWQKVQSLKTKDRFISIYVNSNEHKIIAEICERLNSIIAAEELLLADNLGHMAVKKVDLMAARLEKLKDITWCMHCEIIGNIKKISELCNDHETAYNPATVLFFKKINAILNSIDRLEVRGRDSAGISLMIVLSQAEFNRFEKILAQMNLNDELNARCQQETLVNKGIRIHQLGKTYGKKQIAIAITYKVADEIGRLGDNIKFLRHQIANDQILQILAGCSANFDTVSAHTRWASVGAITEANCHPVDNQTAENSCEKSGIIHTCLNGDIDNYQKLKQEFELSGDQIPLDITTDTKIIPLTIEKYLRQGHSVDAAFRLAVNDFEGSHAISMHTDLAPGKLFLAQKGSGQALFVGIALDHFIPTSEVYGFVEETQEYIKLDGETVVQGSDGPTQGQIFVLNQQSIGGLNGINAMYYDGTPIKFGDGDIKHTEITSRDIDRQGFPHYFLKEISESPDSMEKTLLNRWKVADDESNQCIVTLDDTVIPPSLEKALIDERIKRIFFIGQGTAGVAALACANILSYYLDDPSYYIDALKASEFSGFQLKDSDESDSMADALLIAISQSGTTTDTNRTVDMAKERGAHTLAIVNRRDSDITFKVDGVMYTSSGRDIEMSVASTKAFYSQIVAGAILGLYFAALKKRRSREFVTQEIKQLIELPSHMRKILAMKEGIQKSATKLAVTKTYWAAVGSGPNKASADEIRIKLSELCYKTISSDFVEDKKHIDLSSEPLIIVCAAGTRGTVIGDIIKDTAIFKAHKATPIVIVDEGEERFTPYADAIFHVPHVSEHFAPILNTLVGHIWGYYAALAINDGSRFLYGFQAKIKQTVEEMTDKGLDIFEIILEKSFREKIAEFYNQFRKKWTAKQFPLAIGLDITSDLTLLLKYLSGRLPVSDFDLDFNQKGTAVNMINAFFSCLSNAIGIMARPVDAIKHQAKTVTVGTSRISERLEGILFDALTSENITIAQLTNINILVLKNLQGVVGQIEGSTLYRIDGLNVLGEPGEDTTIEVINKRGDIAAVPSRVESDNRLKGTKQIIVRQGNVYIGKGRKDDRSILVIPILTTSHTSPNKIEYMLLLHVAFKEIIAPKH